MQTVQLPIQRSCSSLFLYKAQHKSVFCSFIADFFVNNYSAFRRKGFD